MGCEVDGWGWWVFTLQRRLASLLRKGCLSFFTVGPAPKKVKKGGEGKGKKGEKGGKKLEARGAENN
jgi:phage gpG-like protein